MGYRREYISLAFRNQNDLFTVRRDLLPLATKNREMLDAVDTYAEVVAGESSVDQLGAAAMEIDMEDAWGGGGGGASRGGFVKDAKDKQMNPQDAILDIREYDVPYYLRVAIDKSASRLLDLALERFLTFTSPQTFESDSGTKSRLRRARSPSASCRSESPVPSRSSWRSISKPPRHRSSSPTSSPIRS